VFGEELGGGDQRLDAAVPQESDHRIPQGCQDLRDSWMPDPAFIFA
jgi:hypothetical protein